MKKIVFLLMAFTLVATAPSCKKSNAKSIVGTWKVTSVTQGSKNRTTEYLSAGYKETYDDAGNYSYSGQPDNTTTGSGKYAWDNETVFKRNGVTGQSSVTITITKLDKSTLSYNYTDNGDLWVFSFAKQ